MRRQAGDSIFEWFDGLAEPRDKVYLNHRVSRLLAYDDNQWDKHKSPDRYLRHLLCLPTCSLVQRLSASLVLLLVLSLGIVVATTTQGWQFPRFDIDPFNLSATALGLLLTLRVSESYNRFRLAHQGLASISGRLRDSARCLAAGLSHWDGRDAALDELCKWLLAVSEAAKCRLRPAGMEDLSECLRAVGLNKASAEQVAGTIHPSSAIISELSGALVALQRDGLLDTGLAMTVQQNLSDVVASIALLERIQRHPVPIKFTRHTSRVMLSWLVLLPLGLVEELGFATVPAVVILGFGLLGIEDIAVQIEEPFAVIDIEDINKDLKLSIDQIKAHPLVRLGTTRGSDSETLLSAEEEAGLSAVLGR